MTKPRKWQLLGRPEPSDSYGQRFFVVDDGAWDEQNPAHMQERRRAVLSGGVEIYVCDGSGADPDRSDDGPMVLDRSEPIEVGSWSLHCSAAATVRYAGGSSRVPLTLREAVWLVTEAGFSVSMSVRTLRSFEAHEVLLNAGRKKALAKKVAIGSLPFPEAWAEHWRRWGGEHSMLRCPGGDCPGGCGASAREALAEIFTNARLEVPR